MKWVFSIFVTLAAVVIFIFLSSCSNKEGAKMVAVVLPEEGLTVLSKNGVSEEDFKKLALGSERNEVSGIARCPYYSLHTGKLNIPLYSTPVYLGSTAGGALHSWGTLEVSNNAFPLDLSLEITGFDPVDSIILPENLGVSTILSEKKCTAEINGYGTYTFLFNGASQEYALTVFVRQYIDENAEIERYRSEYGYENVHVFNPGLHRLDKLDFISDGKVLYFQRGSLVIANHIIDMNTSEDKKTITEEDARSRSIYQRYPFINAFQENRIVIGGSGTIDYTGLELHERSGLCFSRSADINISGLTLVNPALWAITLYRCENIDISNVAILGYRINSDGIALCNSKNALVKNCFARSGDDLFEVKTLGGQIGSIAENIVFDNCIAWNGKARCFGIIAETQHEISDITFKNCTVIYRDATWDPGILGSLVVFASEGVGQIKNVLFENIEIFRDFSSPINCTAKAPVNQGGYEFTDIVFRNIRVSNGGVSILNSGNSHPQNKISVTFEDIRINGKKLTDENMNEFFRVYKAEFKLK